MNLCDSYSLPAKVWLGNRLYFGVSEPEHLEIIFNHPKAVNKDKLVELIQPILGEGLFSAPGIYVLCIFAVGFDNLYGFHLQGNVLK